MKKSRQLLLWVVLLLPYVGLYVVYNWYNAQLSQAQHANLIIISKETSDLKLIDYKGEELFHAPVALGLNYGNKQEKGDMKTPKGVFSISQIQDSETWKHDFGDGNGKIEGAYGPYFIRLNTPGHKGIGIHGTHAPESIGKRTTEGCIRLRNSDLEELVRFITDRTIVIIIPGSKDMEEKASL